MPKKSEDVTLDDLFKQARRPQNTKQDEDVTASEN